MTELTAKVVALAGTWAPPPDLAARLALGIAIGCALAAVLGRGGTLLGVGSSPLRRRRFLEGAAFTAALLSVAYVALYLRGGPRIIDATTYWLQGRALAEGGITFTTPSPPSASFRGRFLLFDDPGTIAGIFPPGHPLLLAFGFGLGAPMIVGPLLAAGLVVATYRLTLAIARDAVPAPSAEVAARLAALVSVSCAALRYHTADPMAHATSALAMTIALERALAASRDDATRTASFVFGLAVGYVVATRPVSAIGIAVVGTALVARRARAHAAVPVLLGLLPGVILLIVGQRAATGGWLESSQRAYYAIADGPPGCFRWGFGAGVGCVYEHGDFVRAELPDGYGLVEATKTTLRRLHAHLLDVGNFEPIALLVLAPLARGFRTRAGSAALALVVVHVLAYAPFYFDGNYPGGGARMFADVLPIEHAIIAVAVIRLATGAASVRPGTNVDARSVRASMLLLTLIAAGFAFHAAHEHQKLAVRDGGRPMFEPDVLSRAHVTRGLVFVDTDHAFGLAHQPGATTATGLVVARLREDDHDAVLYERLGRPAAWLYKRGFDDGTNAAVPAAVVPWTPPALGSTLRFEAEAEWPPLARANGFAVPVWTETCASGGRALVLTPADARTPATATLALPVPATGRYRIVPRIVHGARVAPAGDRAAPTIPPEGELRIGERTWTWTERTAVAPPSTDGCEDLGGVEVDIVVSDDEPEARIFLEARGGPVGLDRITVERLAGSSSSAKP